METCVVVTLILAKSLDCKGHDGPLHQVKDEHNQCPAEEEIIQAWAFTYGAADPAGN